MSRKYDVNYQIVPDLPDHTRQNQIILGSVALLQLQLLAINDPLKRELTDACGWLATSMLCSEAPEFAAAACHTKCTVEWLKIDRKECSSFNFCHIVVAPSVHSFFAFILELEVSQFDFNANAWPIISSWSASYSIEGQEPWEEKRMPPHDGTSEKNVV